MCILQNIHKNRRASLRACPLNLNYENFIRFRLQRYENYLIFANLSEEKKSARLTASTPPKFTINQISYGL